ncbi:hypothetical protein DFH09DRAFT_1193795 [Mycena vulgaris]|nr:hypothetical protein DFH09DRAFT_1227436 [Mycena vulgaris]KAJ6520819.1 hypothetical protein DFH09DRAFT_1193795 [Mycena vulgaris]
MFTFLLGSVSLKFRLAATFLSAPERYWNRGRAPWARGHRLLIPDRSRENHSGVKSAKDSSQPQVRWQTPSGLTAVLQSAFSYVDVPRVLSQGPLQLQRLSIPSANPRGIHQGGGVGMRGEPHPDVVLQ